MIELWKPIPGYEGHYEAGDQGNIRSMDRRVRSRMGTRIFPGRVLKQYLHPSGYYTVNLSFESQVTGFKVHRLVLAAFRGPCPEGFYGCHNDGDPLNNRLTNLRWDAPSGNSEDQQIHGTQVKGETHGMARLTEDAVRAIKRRTDSTAADVAQTFGISVHTVRAIRKGKRWAHVI